MEDQAVFLLVGDSLGEELVIQQQIPSQKFLFFSFFMYSSCLKWFFDAYSELNKLFLFNRILTQNYERKIYSKIKKIQQIQVQFFKENNYYSFRKVKYFSGFC